jgi:hypothetical protein
MNNKHKSVSGRKQPLSALECMIKHFTGEPRHVRVVSINNGHGALQPLSGEHRRPIWLPLGLIYEWNRALFEEIQAAYESGDAACVNNLWARAKQIEKRLLGQDSDL